MNARWQQALIVSQCTLALAWWVWQWPHSPARAWGGLLALLSWGLWWLGVQVACMQYINARTPGVVCASPAQVLRAWVVEAWVASWVFGWLQPFRHRAQADFLPEPQAESALPGVLLLHGFMCNRGLWNPWLQVLRARGQAAMALTLEPAFGSIDDYADSIDRAVRHLTASTGRAPVLLCHSMGGLAARAWLRAYPDASTRVARIITLGAPHYGTWPARMSRTVNGQQMRLDSAWIEALAATESPAVRALFTCWYSDCDAIVFPAPTACLEGAEHRFVPGVGHLRMLYAPQVVQACLQDLASVSPCAAKLHGAFGGVAPKENLEGIPSK